MWPRTAEIMLGLWLMASPFIFRYPDDATALWWIALAGGLVIGTVSVLTFARALRRLHLLNIAFALALTAHGWLIHPGAPSQNHIGVGLLLLMLAIIPSEASLPPVPWREGTQST